VKTGGSGMNPGGPLPPEVVDAWRHGDKFEAIKRLRTATGLGLAEAKAALEALDRQRTGTVGMASRAHSHAPPSGLSPGEVPRTTGGLWAVALVIVVLVLAGWLYTALA